MSTMDELTAKAHRVLLKMMDSEADRLQAVSMVLEWKRIESKTNKTDFYKALIEEVIKAIEVNFGDKPNEACGCGAEDETHEGD